MTDRADGPGVIPHLVVDGGDAAIAFYVKAFGAVEETRHLADDGRRLMHAALRVNGGTVMLHDHFPEFGSTRHGPPTALGSTTVTLHLEFATPDDANAAFDRAVGAGATVVFPIGDQFWGARYGQVADPFGHVWSIGAPLAG